MADCLRSVVRQTYRRWELIVVDDGSSDDTVRVVRGVDDPRIRVVEQAHRGIWRLRDTYNDALARAQGSLVAIIEGDDLWPADRLERQVPAFAEPGVVLSYGPAGVIDDVGRLLRPAPLVDAAHARVMTNAPPGSALRLLLGGNQLVACTALVARSALDRLGGFVQPAGLPAVDYATWLHLSTLGEFRVLRRPMGYWRLHRAQVSQRHYQRLQRGACACAVSFFLSLDPARQETSGWTLQRLLSRQGRVGAHACCGEGRLRLQGGDRPGAARLFGRAICGGDWRNRRDALLGLACAASGVDMERVTRRAGRLSGAPAAPVPLPCARAGGASGA